MSTYNTTQLNPFTDIEDKQIVHRDLLAHVGRWSFVMNNLHIGDKVLDFGCGVNGLAEMMYRNKFKPTRFVGLDIRKNGIEKNKVSYPWAEFYQEDLTGEFDYGVDWDLICSFEVIEHVGKQNGLKFMQNINKHCTKETTVLISTPSFDPEVGAAGNHTYNGGPQEFWHDELKTIFAEAGFVVRGAFGTFASKKDYFDKLSSQEQALWNRLHNYYDSNVMSVLFAPLFPRESRNCMWILQKA